MSAADDKALIASSEFDASAYVKGIGDMTSSITVLNAQEDALRKTLADTTTALNANKAALASNQAQLDGLNKTSDAYENNLESLTDQHKQLTDQQKVLTNTFAGTAAQLKVVSSSTDAYKAALAQVGVVAKQVSGTGANLFDVGSVNARVQEIVGLGAQFRDIFQGKIDTGALDDLEAKLASTEGEFQKLQDVVTFAQQNLSKLDPNTEGFADLTQVVTTGKDVLQQFGTVQDGVATKTESVRQRIAALRNEMVNMREAGKEDTDAFRQIQAQAGDLQDSLDRVNERIHTFSNDTRLIEGGIEAIRGIAAGFELAEGASALFGVKSEEVEQSIMRLNAIMAIANGLQEISNLLKKDSVVRLVAEEVATKAYIATQRILAVTLGTTASASRGLASVLAATGVGALIVGISILLSVLANWTSATQKEIQAQDRLNASVEVGIDFNTRYINSLGNLGRFRAAEAEQVQAANQKIRESDVQKLKDQAANAEQLRALDVQTLNEQIAQAKKEEDSQAAGAEDAAQRIRKIIDEGGGNASERFATLQKTIDNFEKVQSDRINLEGTLETKLVQNQRDRLKERVEIRQAELAQLEEFTKQVQDLQKRLADSQDKQARQDAATLTKTAEDNLQAEFNAIDTQVRTFKLTDAQGNVLKAMLKQIASTDLSTELRDFEKKAVEAQQQIEDAILDLRLTSAKNRADLLRDELEKEAADIVIESRQEFAKLETERTAALTATHEAFQAGLITEGQFEANVARYKAVYNQLFDDLSASTLRKQEQLARDSFDRGKALLEQLFAESAVDLSERTNQRIAALTKRFADGKIRYDAYQRALTAILLRESKERTAHELAEANEALAATQRRLAAENDPQQRKALQDQIIALRAQIAALQRTGQQQAAETTNAGNVEFKRRVDLVASYATAVGGVVNAVVSFWQAANDAEQKSLQRSIDLQQTRVAAATTIAQRGNASYLKLEQDRLDALQLQQENAAKRQLAINAVLQASQALVAFTAALAQGISTGGPLGGIAIAAATLALLASGYAIIQSLQTQNQSTQKLYVGSKHVKRGPGDPAGVDTVPAMLTEGEYVAPVDVANDYRPALAAIYDRKVEPAALNAFVQGHHVNRRQLAALNYGRMAEASDVHVTYDGRLAAATEAQSRQLAATNEHLEAVHATLQTMGVSVKVDKKGLAISLMRALKQADINKKL